MSNCNCHNVPYVNEYDNICRVKWSQYEALMFFMGKGLNKNDSEQCVKNLQVDVGIQKLRIELDRVLDATIKEFQLKCRETLSKDLGESVYKAFVYKNKGGKEKRKEKYITKDLPRKKTKVKHYNKKVSNIKGIKGKTRPICVEKGCVRLAKKRYYKGEHKSYSLYCEKNKGHETELNNKRVLGKLWRKKK